MVLLIVHGILARGADDAQGAKAKNEEAPGEKLLGKPAPALKFPVYNSHAHIDLADLRGKMVVIDFFECERSKDTSGFDDLADVEHSYGPKGVVVLGVSADMNPSAITAMLKKKGNIDWPIDYDPTGFSGKTCEIWQESKKVGGNEYMSYFHLDYIVSPDGVILWTGQPDQVGRALDSQLKDHPPMLVDPATMNAASTALDKMNAAIGDNNLVEAWKQRSRIADSVLSNDDFAARTKDADAKFKDAGDAEIKSIDDLIASKQYPEAQARLSVLKPIDDSSPLATAIKSHVADLQRNADAKAAIAAAANKSKADELLQSAQQLQSTRQTSQAYNKFKQLVRQFPGTPQADEATAAIKAIDAARPTTVPTTMKANSSADHARARSLLNLADSYRDTGNYQKATEKYQAIIDQYPTSDEATAARAAMAKLPK